MRVSIGKREMCWLGLTLAVAAGWWPPAAQAQAPAPVAATLTQTWTYDAGG